MTNLYLILKSTNKDSIYKFLFFLCLKNSLKKQLNKKVCTNKITILKSPHVFKKSQEKFEKVTFKITLKIQTKNLFQYIIFLKVLKNSAFSDCELAFKYIINNKTNIKLGLRYFYPMNFKINKYYYACNKKQNRFINKSFLFLKIFAIYGELFKY